MKTCLKLILFYFAFISLASAEPGKFEQLSYDAPAAWETIPSNTIYGINIRSPEIYPLMGMEMSDVLTLRKMKSDGMDLDALKAYVANMNQQDIERTRQQFDKSKQQVFDKNGQKLDLEQIVNVEISDVNNIENAFLTTVDNVISMNNQVTPWHTETLFILVDDVVYTASFSYSPERKAHMEKIGTAFIKSVQLQ